jgi:hypothetical protein
MLLFLIVLVLISAAVFFLKLGYDTFMADPNAWKRNQKKRLPTIEFMQMMNWSTNVRNAL